MENFKILHAKKETTYGTDAAPTAVANAVLTRNFSTTPVVTDRITRNLDRGVRGGAPDAPSNARQTFGYEMELAGSGAAGTAPAWMEHLEACTMAAPVLTATTKAEQRFAAVGTLLSSLTAYHWHGGAMRRRALGSRGTFSLDFTAGQYPFVKLEMTGLLPAATPIDAVAPAAPTLTRWKDPVEVNTANTAFTLDGFALKLRSLKLAAAVKISARNLVGGNYIQAGDHELTGTIEGECPDVPAKNYFTNLLSGAEAVMALTHGTVPGNIVKLDTTHLQITAIELQEDDDGVLMVSMSVRINSGTSPDDLLITAQ